MMMINISQSYGDYLMLSSYTNRIRVNKNGKDWNFSNIKVSIFKSIRIRRMQYTPKVIGTKIDRQCRDLNPSINSHPSFSLFNLFWHVGLLSSMNIIIIIINKAQNSKINSTPKIKIPMELYLINFIFGLLLVIIDEIGKRHQH